MIFVHFLLNPHTFMYTRKRVGKWLVDNKENVKRNTWKKGSNLIWSLFLKFRGDCHSDLHGRCRGDALDAGNYNHAHAHKTPNTHSGII